MARWTRVPRTLFASGGVGERIVQIDDRVSRLQRGWNQHIPGLLESMSEALGAARQAEDVHRRLDALREDLDRLATRVEFHLIDGGHPLHAGGTEVVRPMGVMMTLVQERGRLLASSEAQFTELAGSIEAIKVGVGVNLSPQGEGLEVMLRAWFNLLAPGGALVIDRFRPGDLETAVLDVVSFTALQRLSASSAFIESSNLPTDCQLLESLRRCGFEGVEARSSASGLVIGLVGQRPEHPGI